MCKNQYNNTKSKCSKYCKIQNKMIKSRNPNGEALKKVDHNNLLVKRQ